MKFAENGEKITSTTASLPVRGAWVEMAEDVRPLTDHVTSLPVRGAWVEIAPFPSAVPSSACRSPCGERGLKFFEMRAKQSTAWSLPVRGAWVEICSAALKTACGLVAPRAGSVG